MLNRVFGRLYTPDVRDDAYPLRAVAPRRTARTRRLWADNYWWGDQGSKPQCVGYAWGHWVEDGPVTHPPKPHPYVDPAWLYREAQKVDEWPGEDYEGTSVRAAAKVLQRRGLIKSYHWAGDDFAALVRTLLESGPVVVGTNWYDGMTDPDGKGFVRLTGAVIGGHAYVLNGIDTTAGWARIKNSWGRAWGNNGRARIRLTDLRRLLADEGEACLAVEGP